MGECAPLPRGRHSPVETPGAEKQLLRDSRADASVCYPSMPVFRRHREEKDRCLR